MFFLYAIELTVADSYTVLGQEPELQTIRIAFCQKIWRRDYPSFTILHEEASKACKGKVYGTILCLGFVYSPKVAYSSTPRIVFVYFRCRHRNAEASLRPGEPAIV